MFDTQLKFFVLVWKNALNFAVKSNMSSIFITTSRKVMITPKNVNDIFSAFPYSMVVFALKLKNANDAIK